mmetsp:Transcript_70304/g.123932  ORF Transcript_70304/g.123932 Transcript_70304/m.123932 type:complete len:131 (-) Transcript_70304:2011-2403(-)
MVVLLVLTVFAWQISLPSILAVLISIPLGCWTAQDITLTISPLSRVISGEGERLPSNKKVVIKKESGRVMCMCGCGRVRACMCGCVMCAWLVNHLLEKEMADVENQQMDLSFHAEYQAESILGVSGSNNQ